MVGNSAHVNGNGIVNDSNSNGNLNFAQGFGTKAIHIGQEPDPNSGAVNI